MKAINVNQGIAMRALVMTAILVMLGLFSVPSMSAVQVSENVKIQTPGTNTTFIMGSNFTFDKIEVHSTYLTLGNATISVCPSVGSIDFTLFNFSIEYWKWNESCSNPDATTNHAMGGLKTNTPYLVKVNGAIYGHYTSNDSGYVFFTYSGGFSEIVFEMEEESISTPNEVYLVPQHSSANGYCKTTDVEIWANATEFQGGQINLTYDSTCANVTNWVRNTTNFLMGGWLHYDGRVWITFSTMDPQPPLLTGEYMVGTLTIHCVNDSTEGCITPLAFIEPSTLLDDTGKSVTATWIDGTFECISGLCGDVAPYPDCSGIVDMGDVILLLNNVSYPGNPRYVLCNEWAGDCRCTDVRDMGDVILLLNNVSYPGNLRYALDCC